MSVTLKGKWLLLAVFIFGCMSTLVIKDISFVKNAIAKTQSKCQYVQLSNVFPRSRIAKGRVLVKKDKDVDALTRGGWEYVSQMDHGEKAKKLFSIWKKCSRG